jgi:hypothetical protein
MLTIQFSRPASFVIPIVEVGQFDQQDRGLNRVQSTVEGQETVNILLSLPVVPQQSKSVGNFRVLGHNCTAIPVSPQIFTGIKTEAPGVAERTRPFTFVIGAMCLAGVFDYFQTVFVGELPNRMHFSRLAKQMHGHDRFGARCNGPLNQLHVHVVIGVVDIHQHGPGAGMGNRESRCHK